MGGGQDMHMVKFEMGGHILKELTLVNEENISLREAVYLTLRRAILTNVFEPGDRLMEMKLAAQLGVSRTPVREAIHLLEKESLVRQIPHKGVVVAGITKKQLRDVLEIRSMLEELAVQLACRRGTEAGFIKLQAAAADFAKAVKQEKDVTVLAEKDVAFHDVIYHMTDNERLIELVGSIWQQIYRYRIERLKGANREILAQEHQNLVHALIARDEEAAVRMARLHISNQEVTISRQLEK